MVNPVWLVVVGQIVRMVRLTFFLSCSLVIIGLSHAAKLGLDGKAKIRGGTTIGYSTMMRQYPWMGPTGVVGASFQTSKTN